MHVNIVERKGNEISPGVTERELLSRDQTTPGGLAVHHYVLTGGEVVFGARADNRIIKPENNRNRRLGSPLLIFKNLIAVNSNNPTSSATSVIIKVPTSIPITPKSKKAKVSEY